MAANSIRAYLTKLQKARADLPKVLTSACKKATIRAVEATTEATPPKADTGRGPYIGANTVTGGLKQHWVSDSQVEPVISGTTISTALKNDLPYASYVNDGHRLDRHFVPGLHINEDTGLLEYDPGADVGIVVGTKTKFVKGEFMVDKGKEAYIETLKEELGVQIKELLT